MDSFLLSELGFTRCRFDTCIYIHDDGTMIVLYVDYMLLMGKGEAVAEVWERIGSRFDVVCLGPVRHFLGMVIERDRAERRIFISQAGYIERILERVALVKCNSVTTPLIPKKKLTPRRKDSGSNAEPKADEQRYMKGVGSVTNMEDTSIQDRVIWTLP